MQRQTTPPPAILEDVYNGRRFFLLRRDNRYHRKVDDPGQPISDFYGQQGELNHQFRVL